MAPEVGIAVTGKVDKLIRETMRALPHGHEATAILDSMFVREQAGWKLYHGASIKWYVAIDPVIRLVHDVLKVVTADWAGCARYVIVYDAESQTHGLPENPFNLRYVRARGLQYDTGEKTK